MTTALVLAKKYETEAIRHFQIVKDYVIESDEEFEDAGNVLKRVKLLMKQVEDDRTQHVKPLNDQVRETNALFKPATDFLKQAETVLKAAIGRYTVEKQEQQRRLLMAAQEEASKQRVTDVEPPQAAITLLQAAQQAAAPKVQGVSVREVWVWELTDPKLVPAQYCSPDPAKLDAAVANGARDIPGVVVRKESRVIARAG